MELNVYQRLEGEPGSQTEAPFPKTPLVLGKDHPKNTPLGIGKKKITFISVGIIAVA